MKKHIILIVCGCLWMAACNRKLDLAPENTLVDRDLFKTEAGAEQALSEGYYNLFRAATGNITYTFGDFTTSNLQHSAYYDIYDQGETTPADEPVQGIWTAYFKTINIANNIIAKIPVYAQFSTDMQQQFRSEARFIRAFAYLELLKMFGEGALTGNMGGKGLPLQLTPFEGYNTGQVIARSNNGEIYAQIIGDLEESLPNLPDQQANDLKTRSRATKGSANALLARTLLYMKNYNGAAEAAKAVLDKTDIYSLTPDLLNLFPHNPDGTAKAPTAEYVLCFPVSQMSSASQGVRNNIGMSYFFKRAFWINPGFISLFETGDRRVSQLMFKGDSIYNPDRFGDKTTFKFNNSNEKDNVPVIRLAEVMLIRAEALANEQGVNETSVSLLNQVRNRSVTGATPYTTGDFADKEALVDMILAQRRFELAFEGFYRYDLIRTGQPLHNPDIPETKKVLPIPQIEVDISKGLIEQNTGY